MASALDQHKSKWKRKHEQLEEQPTSMSPLGKCLLEQFAAGTSVTSLASSFVHDV
jgi:hypothetical protein